ncbi:hypothetical protein PMZ80_004230 [Knufia obscura]|uniref:Uncharacterized protein n=2 Tax=Knufia TaxID=430999 RepID=A0AAN8EFW1_9EURO|nr:hypothetical protein PMZ80_004230 [Knufia obscura]KAK5948645.1 hypothetical protein OHC33_010247 [Knufia fluminis]
MDTNQHQGSAGDRLVLSDQHPWLVARMIQFIYTKSYDEHHNDAFRNGSSALDVRLAGLMKQHQNNKEFDRHREKDGALRSWEVHVYMCGLARILNFEDLMSYAWHKATQFCPSVVTAEDLLSEANQILPSVEAKQPAIRKIFFPFFCEQLADLSAEFIKDWVKNDTEFAIDAMVHFHGKWQDAQNEQRATKRKTPLQG